MKRCNTCNVVSNDYSCSCNGTIDMNAMLVSHINEEFTRISGVMDYPAPIQSKKEDSTINMTLPTDSKERKEYPIMSGCLNYFPAALAGISNVSKTGNDKHNPGEPLHHARGKSMDHGDCILRHLMDTEGLIASHNRGENVTKEQILTEANQMAWRALAYSQMLHEKFGTPLAPGAKE